MEKNYKNKQFGTEDAKTKTPKVAGNDYIFPLHGLKINATSAQEAEKKLKKILEERDAK